MSGLHVLVMAKAPEPGKVKTRLTPPLTPVQAAALAEASLVDTLEAVLGCGASRRVLVLDGTPGPWLPAGFHVVPQRGVGLAERLTAAWADAAGPGLQIGMDTPQVTSTLLDRSLAALEQPSVDAVLGPSDDGGWWAIGLLRSDPRIFRGIPMSTSRTGRLQQQRLDELGLRTIALPTLRDVDDIVDADAVAAAAPTTRFALTLARCQGVPAP